MQFLSFYFITLKEKEKIENLGNFWKKEEVFLKNITVDNCGMSVLIYKSILFFEKLDEFFNANNMFGLHPSREINKTRRSHSITPGLLSFFVTLSRTVRLHYLLF